jgi:hypothetical protein
MLRDGEVLGVCDVFGEQSLNVDRSGEGSRDLFERSMARFAPATEVRVFARRSDHLTTDHTTSCRFFHIDGGHRPADVINDLIVAERALLPDAIVPLDDAFNLSWPGVAEGLHQFMHAHPAVFAPLVIGGNKMFLIPLSARERYEQQLDRIVKSIDSPAFGFEHKEWLGITVLLASRREWVDLNPVAAAPLHLRRGSWRERLLRLLDR